MRRGVIIYVLLGIAGVVIFFSLFHSQFTFLFMQLKPPISYSMNTIEKSFIKHKGMITETVEYLGKLEFSDIYIPSCEEGEIFVCGDNTKTDYYKVSDDMVKTINSLMQLGYQVIIKENNGIYFQRWSNLDYGRGVVYSLDGEEPQNEHITILEPLLEENWYFYEEE